MANQTLSPISLERVAAMFDREGWKYDRIDANTLRTGFSGIGMEIKYAEPAIMFVTTAAVDVVTADRLHEVLTWVEEHNAVNAYPTLSAGRDDERNLCSIGATYAMPSNWEYTDEQFAKHVATGIQGMVSAARDFLRDFAPEVLEKLPPVD